MDIVIQWAPLIYFGLFISIALLYRNYRVYRDTGINALKQKPQTAQLKRLALVLKVHFVLMLALVFDASLQWDVLTGNRYQWLESDIIATFALVLLSACLPMIILSQVQMSHSWRIEVDQNNSGDLITQGLFQYSRNPIFLAIRLGYFALFLLVPCPYSLAVFLLGDICFQMQVCQEEKALETLYGQQYQQYCQQVPRWL